MDEWRVQGSTAWLEKRKNMVTASDISCIMGINPWCSALTCWKRKLGLVEEQEDSAAMRHGRNTEAEARRDFEDMTGYKMVPDVVVHSQYPFLMASLDGIHRDKIQGDRIVEIKCPTSRTLFDQARQQKIPDYYMAQVQTQIACADVEWAYYSVYYNGESAVMEIERDNDMIQQIYEAAAEFYRRIQDFDPPPDSVLTRDDEEWKRRARLYTIALQERKKWDARCEEAKAELIEISSSKSTQGCGVRLTRSIRKGTVQYKDIPELRGVNLDLYRGKPAESWMILVDEKYS